MQDTLPTVRGYALHRKVGSGGSGVVWKASDRSGHLVALKVLSSSNPMLMAFCAAEVQSLCRLQHPHIVDIVDEGQLPDGRRWLATEWCDRGCLRPDTCQSWDDVCRLVWEIGEALAHAHARGVLHRDVKPANILINEMGQFLLADFGLASVFGHAHTYSGGTPDYMPPECREGNRWAQGPGTDIYSLAGVVCFALTGRPPPARAAGAPLQAIQARFPLPDDLHEWLERQLRDCPDDRALTCREALATFPGRPVASHRRSERTPPVSWRLLHLRQPPFVGRRDEISWLIQRFRAWRSKGATNLVVVHGAEGVGRRRLCEVVAEQIHVQAGLPWRTFDQHTGEGPNGWLPGQPRVAVVVDSIPDVDDSCFLLATALAAPPWPALAQLPLAPLAPGLLARALKDFAPVCSAEASRLADEVGGYPGAAVTELRRRQIPVAVGQPHPSLALLAWMTRPLRASTWAEAHVACGMEPPWNQLAEAVRSGVVVSQRMEDDTPSLRVIGSRVEDWRKAPVAFDVARWLVDNLGLDAVALWAPMGEPVRAIRALFDDAIQLKPGSGPHPYIQLERARQLAESFVATVPPDLLWSVRGMSLVSTYMRYDALHDMARERDWLETLPFDQLERHTIARLAFGVAAVAHQSADSATLDYASSLIPTWRPGDPWLWLCWTMHTASMRRDRKQILVCRDTVQTHGHVLTHHELQRCRYRLAMALYSTLHPDDLSDALDILSGLDPAYANRSDVLAIQASAAQRSGDLELALELNRAAIQSSAELAHDVGGLQTNAVELRLLLGRDREVAAMAEKLLRRPEYRRRHRHVNTLHACCGLAFGRLGDWERAIPHLRCAHIPSIDQPGWSVAALHRVADDLRRKAPVHVRPLLSLRDDQTLDAFETFDDLDDRPDPSEHTLYFQTVYHEESQPSG